MEAELINNEGIVESPTNSIESGRNDLFTTLPDDCIFSIFSFLDRESFETIQGVSQKMNFMAHYKGFRIPKKDVYEFVIEQDVVGQTICVSKWDKEEYSFVYTINRNSQEVKKQFKGSYYDWKSSSIRDVRPAPVKKNVFNALKFFNSKYATDRLSMVRIHIDQSFLSNLIEAFTGKIPGKLEFEKVSIHEKVDLANFILTWNIHKLVVVGGSKRMHTIFDEEFVTKFSLGKDKSITLDFHEALWTPSRQFLPVICRFENFNMDSLVFTTTLLEELVVLCFNTIPSECGKYWSVSLDVPVDENNFRLINTGTFSIEKDVSEELAVLTIRKTNHQSYIEITPHETRYGLYPIFIMHTNSE